MSGYILAGAAQRLHLRDMVRGDGTHRRAHHHRDFRLSDLARLLHRALVARRLLNGRIH